MTSYNRFTVTAESPGSIRQRDALLIRLELNKIILLVFLVSSFALSVVLGILAGVLRHSLDLGFGVSGGVLGLIGIAEGFLTWWLK